MTDTKYDRSLLEGLPTIARYMNRSVSTIRRWIDKHGFPVGKLPRGQYCTSTALVDEWLIARHPSRHGGRSR